MLSPIPLTSPDYDNLSLNRVSWITSPGDQDIVTHLVFELSQRLDPLGPLESLVKVVRLGSLTPEFFPTTLDPVAAQRDLLSALRHRGRTFLTLIARLPDLPLLFACGAQAVAPTRAEAISLADAAWDTLTSQILGTYNRFLLPLSLSQADALAVAHESWDQVAMVCGHPGPTPPLGEPTQFETFLRSADDPFVLTLVASPLTSGAMFLAFATAQQDLELGVMSEQFEAQLHRAREAMEYGAFLYQLFVLAPSSEALGSISTHLESAFFDDGLATPLRVVPSSSPDETLRLRVHSGTFSSDLRPGPDPKAVEFLEFSSYVTLNELAALAHPTL